MPSFTIDCRSSIVYCFGTGRVLTSVDIRFIVIPLDQRDNLASRLTSSLSQRSATDAVHGTGLVEICAEFWTNIHLNSEISVGEWHLVFLSCYHH